MNAIATRSPSSAIAIVEAGQGRLQSLFDLVTVQGFKLAEIKRELTGEERGFLQGVVSAARASLAPSNATDASASIARMLGAFSTGGATENAALTVSTYAKVVETLPLWAISKAALNFASGSVFGHNPKYQPTSAEFRREIERLLEPVRSAEYRAGLALLAKPIRPTDRRININWREMAGFKAQEPAQPVAMPEEPHEPDLSPVAVSPSLSRALGA